MKYYDIGRKGKDIAYQYWMVLDKHSEVNDIFIY